MARTIRDAKLETRASRDRLKSGRTPHFKTLIPGKLHLGYRRKRKDLPGQWLVRHYIGGERYRVAPLGLADDYQDTADGAGVLDFAEAQRLALAHKGKDGGSSAPLTVTVAIADYVAWLKVHRASGDDAEQRAARHILPLLGKFKVSDLTTVRLNNWRDALAASPALARTKKGAEQNYRQAPSTADDQRGRKATVNRVVTTLKAALNKAFHDGRVNDDLQWRRFKPFQNVSAARPGYLTIDEAQGLINTADPASGFRDLVHAALQTGARYGELSAMRVRDFHRGKIAIHRSKSGKPRDIVLSEEGTAFFERLTVGRDPGALMFELPDPNKGRDKEGATAEKSERPWLKSMQSRPMVDACKAAKIKQAIGFHQLRHTWASHAVMNGVPLMVVARNLGHATTAMVEKHYGHLAPSFIDDAIRAGAPKFGVEVDNKAALQR